MHQLTNLASASRRRASRRLLRFAPALAISSLFTPTVFSAVVSTTLATPLVTDGTTTTPIPNIQVTNIFSHASWSSSAPNEPLPASWAATPGSFTFGTGAALEQPSLFAYPFYFNVVGAPSAPDQPDNPYTAQLPIDSAQSIPDFIPALLAVSTGAAISDELFAQPTTPEASAGIAGGGVALMDESAVNSWLSGPLLQFFIPFRIIVGDVSNYGYLEFAFDYPSLSLALVSYAYEETADTPIITPGAFTSYLPPEPFVMAIPEPASAGLLGALTAGTVIAVRRRRA